MTNWARIVQRLMLGSNPRVGASKLIEIVERSARKLDASGFIDRTFTALGKDFAWIRLLCQTS